LIRGFITDTRPFVRVLISVPRSTVAVPVDMLLDTGSHLSVVSRDVLDGLGVDLSRLSTARRIRAVGIGGSQDYYRLRLMMSFPTSSTEPHPLPVWVSVPISTDLRADSIIGMEALVNFRLTIAASEDRVELEPLF